MFTTPFFSPVLAIAGKSNAGKRVIQFFVLLLSLIAYGNVSFADSVDTKTHYLISGNLVNGWQLVLGEDPEWYQPQTLDKNISKKKAVSFEKKDDAIFLTWLSKSKEGSVTISGQAVDLNEFGDIAAIALDLFVPNQRIKQKVRMSVDCGYPCRGTIALNPLLEVYPKDEWFTLPIPLRCFRQSGTDLTKVNGPLQLQTKGKFTIGVRNVRLVKIPADFQLCKEEPAESKK